MPDDIYTMAARFRQDLLAGERAAAMEMVRAYGASYQRIKEALLALLTRVEAAKARGEYSASWLYQEGRLESLQAQTLSEIHRFAAFAGDTIETQQRQAVYNAEGEAQALVRATLPPSAQISSAGVGVTFSRLPTSTVQSLVGHLQDGSPLKELLDTLAPEAAKGVRDALASGVARGEGSQVISREIRQAMGGPLSRTLTISRTETLRAYREATRQTYQANGRVVQAWQWVASLSRRTCAMCLAMHMTIHPLDEPMGSHPNCRCVMVPVTRPWSELGFDGLDSEAPAPEDGAAWLDRQSEETQLAILGPGKLAAYKRGEITLADLVRYRDDPRWGPTRTEASLADALKKVRGK